MPTYDSTDRYGLRALTGTNLISDVDAGFKALRDDVSAKFASYSSGPLASRPVSTVGTPGIAGRRYRATDTGQEFIDTGTSWTEILQAPLKQIFSDFPTSSTSFVTVGTTTWQVPATGTYEVELSAGFQVTTATGGGQLGFRQGASAPDTAQRLTLTGAPANFSAHLARKVEASLTGGQTIDLQVLVTGAVLLGLGTPRIAIRRL